ncbi:hypothetical protein [Synoicihabitans lomoniglobus]|uniref:Uncharacterized protein n=1 Tax=Synoicihabitans lomoniglobus TaxID=2909285 RepID=A0AAF0A1A7_9BACT|nr:hypothetical protein [Opitutaceae bacterium LMO-M01]WED64867.1 hypothetical protein PXH66_21180 [Opitutaceae bacterium LMO-M01]
MNDPEKDLREHFERQHLSPERATAILAAGREAAVQHARRVARWRWGGMAAVVTLALGGGWWMRAPGGDEPPSVARPAELSPDAGGSVTLATVQSGVMAFFNTPDYQLDRMALDHPELVAWMQTQGAPSELTVPESIDPLDNLGCEVLQIDGVSVYILCFYLDGVPRDETGEPMLGKKLMAVAAPDAAAGAPAMMKPLTLVHLITVPRDQFAGAPQAGDPVAITRDGQWGFATWAGRDVVYVVASPVEAERFREIAAHLRG